MEEHVRERKRGSCPSNSKAKVKASVFFEKDAPRARERKRESLREYLSTAARPANRTSPFPPLSSFTSIFQVPLRFSSVKRAQSSTCFLIKTFHPSHAAYAFRNAEVRRMTELKHPDMTKRGTTANNGRGRRRAERAQDSLRHR